MRKVEGGVYDKWNTWSFVIPIFHNGLQSHGVNIVRGLVFMSNNIFVMEIRQVCNNI
jgi:hypothetical protein